MCTQNPESITKSYTDSQEWLEGLSDTNATLLTIVGVPCLHSADVTSVQLLCLPLPWQSFSHKKQTEALGRSIVLVKSTPMMTKSNEYVIDRLLLGRSVALVGHPGIGKSSEINILLPQIFSELADSSKPLQHVFQRLDSELYHYYMAAGKVQCCIENGAGASLTSLNGYFNNFVDKNKVAKGILPRNATLLLLELDECESDPLFTHIPTLVALSARDVKSTLKTFSKSSVLSFVARGPHTPEELIVLSTAAYHADPAAFINKLGLTIGTSLEEARNEVSSRTLQIGPLARQVLGTRDEYVDWTEEMSDVRNLEQFLEVKESINVFHLPSTSKFFVAPLACGEYLILGDRAKFMMLEHAQQHHIAAMEQIGLAWQLQEKVVLDYFILDKAGRHAGAVLPFEWRHQNWEFYHNPACGVYLNMSNRVDAPTRQRLVDDATKHTRTAYFDSSLLRRDSSTLDPQRVYISNRHTMPVGEYFTICGDSSAGIEACFYSLSTVDPSDHPATVASLIEWKDALNLKSIKLLFFVDWRKKETRGFRVDSFKTDEEISVAVFGKEGCFSCYIVRCGVYCHKSVPQVLLAGRVPTNLELLLTHYRETDNGKVSTIRISQMYHFCCSFVALY